MSATRPFHETIVEAIQRCPGTSDGEILCILWIIRNTKIPSGHDKIIEALDKFVDIHQRLADDDLQTLHKTKVAIDNQKRGLASQKETVNLDQLQEEIKKLLSLLENRQPGLITWNQFLKERVESIHKLTGQTLEK